MATDENGNTDRISQPLTVISGTAPDISFTIDENRCILNSNFFTASDTELAIYNWDFNGEGSGTNIEESFRFTESGEKTITLSVSDGTCTNSVSQTLVIYEEPPLPSFTVSEVACPSTALDLVNTTVDSEWAAAITYEWTFEEDSNRIERAPEFAFLEPGERSVSVVASIPGCTSEMTETAVIVQPQPVADYSISQTCEGEVTNFTDLSQGAQTYAWDFGDGFTSSAQSPFHRYERAGDYVVSLVITNEAGCADSLAIDFSVDHLPIPGFRTPLSCEGDVNLVDTSAVAASDIVAWSYMVEGFEQPFTDQNPSFNLAVFGDYEVIQEVTSAEGCKNSVTQTITVQDAVNADMEIYTSCFGEPFIFSDISTVEPTNPVFEKSWTIDGELINVDPEVMDVEYTFQQPGTFEVTLTLTASNLCVSGVTRTVEVLERPTLDFSIPEICQNDFGLFTDLSTFTNDEIISRQWVLNGALVGNGPTLNQKFSVDGVNEVSLVTTTTQGCLDTLTRLVNVLPAPVAAFESSSEFGAEGSAFSFINASTGSTSYQWWVDGTEVGSPINLDTAFNVSGTREISLIAFSDLACADTSSTEVLVRVPEIDLILSGMELQEQSVGSGFSDILVSVENKSNLPLNGLRFVVEVDDQLPIQITDNSIVEIGRTALIRLDAGIPNQANYICVAVLSNYEGSADQRPSDNARCINIEPQPVFPPLYPNPATDQITIDAVLPTEGQVTISLLDVSGKVELQETYTELNEGLQSFSIELSTYEPGMYFVRIEYEGFTEIKRIVKQ